MTSTYTTVSISHPSLSDRMNDMKIKGKDVLLALLYAKGSEGSYSEPISGTTRLTKAFFLFEKELKDKFTKDKIEDLPEFIAWNYGPWSNQLIDDIDFFVGINFVKIETLRSSDDVSLAEKEEYEKLEEEIGQPPEDVAEDLYAQRKYVLTPLGTKYVQTKIWLNLSDDQQRLLNDFKAKINSISLFSLLRYVYRNYNKKEGEDWTKNSVIKDRVL